MTIYCITTSEDRTSAVVNPRVTSTTEALKTKKLNSKGAGTVNGGEVPELNDISDIAI